MFRRFLMALLIVVALASLSETAQAACSHCQCRRGHVSDYLFGGYCRGPFGYGGGYAYAGYMPPANYTCCGRFLY